MNCKPGDSVFLTKGKNIGKVGAVVGPTNIGMHVPSGLAADWEVDFGRPMPDYEGVLAHLLCYPDSWLRPIRDQPGADETLTWAGKPCDIKAPEAA